MFPPASASIWRCESQDQQFPVPLAQLLAMQDRVGEPQRRQRRILCMREHAEHIQLGRHFGELRPQFRAGMLGVDEWQPAHVRCA